MQPAQGPRGTGLALPAPRGAPAPSLLPPVPGPVLEDMGSQCFPSQSGELSSGSIPGEAELAGPVLFCSRTPSRPAHAVPATGQGSWLGALRLALCPRTGSGCPLVAVVGKGGHELWLAGCGAGTGSVGQEGGSARPTAPCPSEGRLTQRLLLEVGALQAVLCCCSAGTRGHSRNPHPKGADLPLGAAPPRGDTSSPAHASSYRFLGSYMKRKWSSRSPASESQGNLCLRLL